MSDTKVLAIHVAGDVCLDVTGVLVPPPPADCKRKNNWQLTGESRTHYLLGGVLLLADWVRTAVPDADVRSTLPCLPEALARGKEAGRPMGKEEFLQLAERLSREEIVHSLLGLDYFRETPEATERDVLRVDHTHGFSGPRQGDPRLQIQPPEMTGKPPAIIVLDDTGNRFRHTPEQWPESLLGGNDHSALVVYKLHRPLPTGLEGSSSDDAVENSSLWKTVKSRYPDERIVVVSIDDLRGLGAPISRGLSWERTSLELVWQLLNVDTFAPLRDCPHLIVRMGLDGAVYLQCNQDPKDASNIPHRAWLVYDPAGIEGTAQSAIEGRMVGYGSAFVAALVKRLAEGLAGSTDEATANPAELQDSVIFGIKSGLVASRRLLKSGFGMRSSAQADYPRDELFSTASEKEYFACQEIPIILGSTTPDRGYWRILDSVFENKTTLLHRAVALVATGAKPLSDEDHESVDLLKQAPMAIFAKVLRSYDRREIENYRALYSLLLAYLEQPTPPRPLSVAVFGPPGSGKSFGVKQVANAIRQAGGRRPTETLTFNLSQYTSPEQLSDAFHLVRDVTLRGKIPLVFFDEFDTSLAGMDLGWLRYFLAPMQDGEFLDRGTPHPIGQSIFVFAGGTHSCYTEFSKHFFDKSDEVKHEEFVSAKGPDFLSRLRGCLDIPGLDLNPPFDPYGPVDAFPCDAAILLRRASILEHQLGDKAPSLRDSGKTLRVSEVVLRALLHLPRFEHGNRSFEALLDMSQLPGATDFLPSMLPASGHVGLHADPRQLVELLGTHYPFPPDEREVMAKMIHEDYVKERRTDPEHDPDDDSLKDWTDLACDVKRSNYEQADHIAMKLRSVGLWFRKGIPGMIQDPTLAQRLNEHLEQIAQMEHDRWVAEKRRQGWIAAPNQDPKSRNNTLRLHNYLFRWDELEDEAKNRDRLPAQRLPEYLKAAGYVIVEM